MREIPVLFQGAMVRPILAGTKTQTRRSLRVQPGDEATVHVEHFHQTVVDRHGAQQPGPEVFGAWWDDGESGLRCPYGRPGEDCLWVRETWAAPHAFDHLPPRLIPLGTHFHYRATEEAGGLLWRPSIHMPRWASRITLEIVDMRVERLQDISEEDAKAEGCDPLTWGGIEGTAADLIDWPLKTVDRPYANAFAVLWESIHGDGSWATNPWLWAITFSRIKP